MDGSEEVLQRALRYPYATPERSFVLSGGRAADPDEVEVEWAGRETQLAYGANAAPEALARKLAGVPGPLPAQRATLTGFDVVYSRHISAYGAVPATLFPSPGTEVGVFVLRPDRAQQRAIAATEPNYELTRPEGLDCRLEDGRLLSSAPVHVSRHGCLELDGSPVALAAVTATGRRLPALGERQALDRVRAVVSPERSLERFVLDAAADPALARRWTEQLRPS